MAALGRILLHSLHLLYSISDLGLALEPFRTFRVRITRNCLTKNALAIKSIQTTKSSTKVQLQYLDGEPKLTRAELGNPKRLTLSPETLILSP
jgi:hypothetical protein